MVFFNIVFSEDFFMVICYLDRHKTQRMCDKAVDGCLAALKFIFDWFVFVYSWFFLQFLLARKWEKNTTNFYWEMLKVSEMLLVCVSSMQYGSIKTF